MANSESHPALQISFSGESGKACQMFIDHVTEYAFDNDKQGDDEWIADFAGMRLRGAALLWFTELDDEIQESWRKLRKALVRAYRPTSEATVTSYRASGSSSMAPAPAAAQTLTQAANPNHGLSTISQPRRGIIRVITEEPKFSGYVSRILGSRGSIQQTTEVVDAAIMEFQFSDRPHSIRFNITDGTFFSWMGVQLEMGQPDLEQEECSINIWSWGRIVNLTLRDGACASSTTERLEGSLDPATWLVLLDGSLVAVHTDTNSIQHVLEFYVTKLTHELSFALVLKSLQQLHPVNDSNRIHLPARLIFEAI